MDNLRTVAFIVSPLILVLYAERMVGVFYEKRRTSFSLLFLTCLFYGILELIFNFLRPSLPLADVFLPYVAMVLTFIGYFVITLNYKSSAVKRLVVVLTMYIVYLLAHYPVFLAINYYITPYLTMSEIGFLYLLHLLLQPAAAYLVAIVLCRFKNIHRFTFKNVKGNIIVLVLGAFLFIVTWFLPFSGFALTITAILHIGFVFLVFYLINTLVAKYEDKLKSELHTQEKEYYFTQCQLMQESTEQVKAIRHDMKIHLATLKGFAITDNIEDIKSYLDSLVADIEKSETYSHTGNTAFDSIINYKLTNAKTDDIKLTLNIALPSEINIAMIDIVTILGNLLDNALEAVAKVNEKMIKLDIELIKGALFVKVENSFNGEIKYIVGKVEEEQQIASLKDGFRHGYGLKNIKQSVEKYNGYIKITHTENIFSTGVFLYL